MINIYLVEDDKLFRELTHDYLKKNLSDVAKELKIKKLSTGERLLKELHEVNESATEINEQHIIILDYKLSSVYSDEILNGLEILQRVKKLNFNTTVIIVSAQEDVLVVDKLLETGAADYIVKNENTFPRLLNSILRSNETIDTAKKEPQVLYHVVYRDEKKKGGKKRVYKSIAIVTSTLALAELLFILFF